MAWVKKNLAAVLPTDFQNLVSLATSTSQTLNTVSATLKQAVQIIRTFQKTIADPFAALVLALITNAQNLLNDSFGSGFYQLVVTPFTIGSKDTLPNWTANTGFTNGARIVPIAENGFYYQAMNTGVSGATQPLFTIKRGDIIYDNDGAATGLLNSVVWRCMGKTPEGLGIPQKHDIYGLPNLLPRDAIRAAQTAFDDLGDLNRPQFSPSATVAGLAIMATAPSPEQVQLIIQGILTIFKVRELDFFNKKLTQVLARINNTRPPRSVQPDWRSARLRDIPAFGQLYLALNGYLNLARGYAEAGDAAFDQYLQVLQQKISFLATNATKLSNAIQILTGAIGATGIYFLDIPEATGGNAYLKSALADPTFNNDTQNKYTAMILWIAGGPSAAGLATFKTFLK
jgi:hypothetical protein